MSDSVRPHRQQPTRLPRPWDSPGKNTGVGCHFLLQCMKVKSQSEVAQSCLTLREPMDCSYQAPLSMGFSRQEYWSGVPSPSPNLPLFCSKSVPVLTCFHRVQGSALLRHFPQCYERPSRPDYELYEGRNCVYLLQIIMEIQCGRKECILKKLNPDGFECQLLSMYGLNDGGELT